MSICSCRVCGCTDTRACEGGCWWAEPDLCSTCARKHAVRERPLLFNCAMVQALLAGRKTQTRRIMKKPPTGVHGQRLAAANCPYGKPGDRIWVKETWADVNLEGAPGIAYRADGDVRDLMEDRSFLERDGSFNYDDPRYLRVAAGKQGNGFSVWSTDLIGEVEGRWRSSMLMPRWVSRLNLEVTDVRVQRLQDISEDDAIAEGVDGPMCAQLATKTPWRDLCAPVAVHTYAALWDSINGAGAWLANPWVWAITFRRLEGAHG